MIPRSEIDAIKERADIAEVIRSYGVELKGTSTLKGLCPFHNENSPSFSVRPTFGTYHCFGCGERGDVFKFVQEKDGFTFTDAVKAVAERYGMEVTDTRTAEDEEDRVNKRRLFEVMKVAADFYWRKFRELPHEHVARQELRKRQLEEVEGAPDWLQRFGIGYAPEGWTHTIEHLVSKGFTHEEILTVGLAGRTESGRLYDLFRGRLLWQIRDVQGRVVGFGGRRLYDTDKGPKYLNSPQTPLYDKSRVLYGLDLARKAIYDKKEVIFVEGYTDVMAMAAVGIDNVVATSGTAFGDGHASNILRLLGEGGKIIFNFDGDSAGQKAARKTFELNVPIHNMSYVTKAGNGDPCDIRMSEGDLALLDLVAPSNLMPLTDFVLRTELSQHDTTTAEGRSSFLNAAAPLLAHITDYSMREDYLRKVSFWSGSTLEVVKSVMRKDVVPTRRPTAQENRPPVEEHDEEESLMRAKQKAIISLMLQFPDEFYPLMEGDTPRDEDWFDADLAAVYATAWYRIRQGRGRLGKMSPDQFPLPDLILELVHKPFPQVEGSEGRERAMIVQRHADSFYKALRSLSRTSQIQDVRSRIGQAYGDETVTDDISALSEIIKQQKSLRGRNRRQRS